MNLFKKSKHEDGVEYHVRLDGVNDHELIFDSREAARTYKKVLKQSKGSLQGHIIKRVYDSGYILSEDEVY